MGNSGKQAAATAKQQLATLRASMQKRNGLSAEEGGSQQKADWQAKEKLLRSHNLVVGTQ